MEISVWGFLGAKLVLYALLFLWLAAKHGPARPWVALGAATVRLVLGILVIGLTMLSCMVLVGSDPTGRTALTILLWVYRALAWLIAIRLRFRGTSLPVSRMIAGIIAGLAINLGIDVWVWLSVYDGRGGSFMPSLGEWDLHLC